VITLLVELPLFNLTYFTTEKTIKLSSAKIVGTKLIF